MNELRELAYRIDPVLWVRDVLGVEPAPWQAEFLRAPLGASIIALTARQVGKTTAAAGRLRISCVYAGRVERDRLPRAAPKRRSRAAGARDP